MLGLHFFFIWTDILYIEELGSSKIPTPKFFSSAFYVFQSCPLGQFSCNTFNEPNCLYEQLRCNIVVDCDDYSDETGCLGQFSHIS